MRDENENSKLYDMGYNDFTNGRKPQFPGDEDYMDGYLDAKTEFLGLSIEDGDDLEDREKRENEEGFDGYDEEEETEEEE